MRIMTKIIRFFIFLSIALLITACDSSDAELIVENSNYYTGEELKELYIDNKEAFIKIKDIVVESGRVK